MRFTFERRLLATVAAATLLAAATPASAQFGFRLPVSPYGIYNGAGYPAYNPAAMYNSTAAFAPAVPANPYLGASGAQATLMTTPAAPGADPYYNPYNANPYSSYYNPVGGYLSGAADLVSARSNSRVTYQKALLVQEEVFRSRLDTRRKIWEEARYERASLMNSEQYRLKNLQTALDRARHDPPLSEVWSAQSLNDLFNYVSAQQGKLTDSQLAQLPQVPLNEDLLKHINLTTGKDGNAGLLKNDIRWPIPLQRSEFDETRKDLDKQLEEAVRQAKFGAVKANLASDVKNNVQKMQNILLSSVSDLPPADYMTAKNYLKMLDDSARALSDPNVSNYFNDKWSAKGKTVGALVKSVSEKGLKFAPASPGDEWAYTALYRALRDYDAGMVQFVSAK